MEILIDFDKEPWLRNSIYVTIPLYPTAKKTHYRTTIFQNYTVEEEIRYLDVPVRIFFGIVVFELTSIWYGRDKYYFRFEDNTMSIEIYNTELVQHHEIKKLLKRKIVEKLQNELQN